MVKYIETWVLGFVLIIVKMIAKTEMKMYAKIGFPRSVPLLFRGLRHMILGF